MGLFWAPFLARKIVKTSIEKRGPALNDIFGPLEAFWDSFGVDVGVILGACWLPNRAVDRIAETTKSDDVTALLKVLSGSGGSTIYEKRDRKQL